MHRARPGLSPHNRKAGLALIAPPLAHLPMSVLSLFRLPPISPHAASGSARQLVTHAPNNRPSPLLILPNQEKHILSHSVCNSQWPTNYLLFIYLFLKIFICLFIYRLFYLSLVLFFFILVMLVYNIYNTDKLLK